MKQLLLLVFLAFSTAAFSQNNNTLRCDSMLSYSPDGALSGKMEYTYDDRGNMLSQARYYRSGERWKGQSKTVIHTLLLVPE